MPAASLGAGPSDLNTSRGPLAGASPLPSLLPSPVPSSFPTPLPTPPVIIVTTARTWGVGALGSFAGGFNGDGAFTFCNQSLNPPGGCTGQPIFHGMRSFSDNQSASSSICNEIGTDGAYCGGAISAQPALGTLQGSFSLQVAGPAADSSPPPFGNGAASSVQGSVYFQDYITPTSQTLPMGTPVQFQETLNMVGSASCSAPLVAGAGVSVSGYETTLGAICSSEDAKPSTRPKRAVLQTDVETITLAIGTRVSIEPVMQFSGSANDCVDPEFCNTDGVFVEASGTATWTLTPLTPGVSYTTASGRSYIYAAPLTP